MRFPLPEGEGEEIKIANQKEDTHGEIDCKNQGSQKRGL